MYKHYILIDERNRITDRWSDGTQGNRDTTGAIVIREDESYQFRFTPDGEENPQHLTPEGVPLYKWDGTKAIRRPDEDVQADIDALPPPEPSPAAATRGELLEAYEAIALLYERNLALEEQGFMLMEALTEIYEISMGG